MHHKLLKEIIYKEGMLVNLKEIWVMIELIDKKDSLEILEIKEIWEIKGIRETPEIRETNVILESKETTETRGIREISEIREKPRVFTPLMKEIPSQYSKTKEENQSPDPL